MSVQLKESMKFSKKRIVSAVAALAVIFTLVFASQATSSAAPAPKPVVHTLVAKKKIVKHKKKHRVSYYHLSHYNLHQLEVLWIAQGGNKSAAHVAAAIALAESGGHPREISSTNDWGLWQINAPSHPTMYTLDPGRNTTAAIKISSNGRNWSPWVTYQTGAYLRHWNG